MFETSIVISLIFEKRGLLFYNVGYSSLNVRTRANVRAWHNLTRCSYSYTCVECHDRHKHYRRWYILFG
nr:MAG TPA: hypothetical protein [Caudoviricetes sp.]